MVFGVGMKVCFGLSVYVIFVFVVVGMNVVDGFVMMRGW